VDRAYNSRRTHNFFGHNALKRLPRPSYSPDVSLSNVYLFGKVNSPLIGWEISDEIDFLEAVIEILNGIADVELQRAFRSWIERGETVLDAGGGYLPEERVASSLSHLRLTHL
jgi:hypothetical protein